MRHDLSRISAALPHQIPVRDAATVAPGIILEGTMKDGQTVEHEPNKGDLDRQYRKIGISAVAAALRYQGDGKNPAYARCEEDARIPAEAA
jgi:hypothetical protein